MQKKCETCGKKRARLLSIGHWGTTVLCRSCAMKWGVSLELWNETWRRKKETQRSTALPCPCCGSSKLYVGVVAACSYGVTCLRCHLRMWKELPEFNNKSLPMLTLESQTLAKAVKRWNRRTRMSL